MLTTLNDREFRQIQELLYRWAGIRLTPVKKQMVCGRLHKRLAHHGIESYSQYFDMLASGRHAEEVQVAIDLLTTHETHFFREKQHFDFLRGHLRQHPPRGSYKVWSAACSSGEEPYTLAMVLDDELGGSGWEVLGTDISAHELERAKAGHYPMERTQGISEVLLKRYCMRGVGAQEGTFAIDPVFRRRVSFMRLNLMGTLPPLGPFDSIFLRNVLIYFEMDAKRKVVLALLGRLRPGGLLFVGHSESLNGVVDGLTMVKPSVYRKGDA